MPALIDEIVPTLLVVLLIAGGIALTLWALTVRRLALHVERAHPELARQWIAKSKRRVPRMAVVSELQAALARDDAPEALSRDAAAATLVRRESTLRMTLLGLGMILFALFALF